MAHLDAVLNPSSAECSSYFGGTMRWLERANPAVQGNASFSGWVTDSFESPGAPHTTSRPR